MLKIKKKKKKVILNTFNDSIISNISNDKTISNSSNVNYFPITITKLGIVIKTMTLYINNALQHFKK